MSPKKALPPKTHYYRHLAKGFLASSLVIIVSLIIGIMGYHLIAHLSFMDSLLNASMILTGMGPVNVMTTTGAKLFASFYALYSGIAFLSMVALMFAPVFHRFMHRFHLQTEEKD